MRQSDETSSVLLLSSVPSTKPSGSPSVSIEPSIKPSGNPSSTPSDMPSSMPSLSSVPSREPSDAPSVSIQPSSMEPSGEPSSTFSVESSLMPSIIPSGKPSLDLSGGPTSEPSLLNVLFLAPISGFCFQKGDPTNHVRIGDPCPLEQPAGKICCANSTGIDCRPPTSCSLRDRSLSVEGGIQFGKHWAMPSI